MKSILYDIRRALAGRWFLASAVVSAIALYMSIGQESYHLMNELRNLESGNPFYFELANLLRQSMQGDFGIMTLPALAALPFAAQPLQEIKSGAIRPAVFRIGRSAWLMGKGIACFLSGMLLPLISVVILALIFHLVMLICGGMLFPTGDISVIYLPLLSRMICGGIWACIGCMIALLTETAAAAYLAPLCLCYALTMIGTRFFPQIPMLNPSNWMTGSPYPLLFLLIPMILLMALTLRREVYRHA